MSSGQQISGISTYECHDAAHDIQIVRSPEVWGPVTFSALTAGGMGTAVGPGPNDRTINAGFMGFALRRVSDGAYVAATRATCPAGSLTGYCSGTPERVEIPISGEAGEKYTIDVIDNYFGGWFDPGSSCTTKVV